MGIFSSLKRGGDKKKKAGKYHEGQPSIAEKDILNQAFLGDDPYLRAGGPAKLFPGNDGFRPHEYRPGTPGSDIESIYSGPAHGSGYGSNYGSRNQSPAVLQPPQFSQFSNSSALDLPSRPWSSGTGGGPHQRTNSLGAGPAGDSSMAGGGSMFNNQPPRFAGHDGGRPGTSHGSGPMSPGGSQPSFASRFGPAHQRTDTQGTATPASRPGSQAASRAGTQSPQSPTHSNRNTKSPTSTADKNLSTSSASPTENSETSQLSQLTSATAATTSDGPRAASPPSTVSGHSRPPSSAGKVWPIAEAAAPETNDTPASPLPNSPTPSKETRARDAAKRKDLAIEVPRRRSWSAQINQLEKAWLEEQLSSKYQQTQENDAVPSPSPNAQLDAVPENQAPAAGHKPSQPMSPKNVPPQDNIRQRPQQRLSPQDMAPPKQDGPRQSPRTPQGPSPGPRGHMNSQSTQQFPIRRGPAPNGRSFDSNYDPRFDPRNDPRFDPRFDPRNDPRAASRQGPRPWPQQQPPQQMPHPPPNAGPRGRTVDYNFMPSSIDQYGGVGGGPYAMGRTARAPPPGVQMADVPIAAAPRSASGGVPRPHRQMASEIDISTPIDMGGRMPETRLPAALRGSQSMQQLPRAPRDPRGPMPMSPPGAQQPPYHSRAGSMASQVSQGSHYNRGYPHPHPHPPPPPGMRSASAQGMRSPVYPMPLPAVGMREGGSRYPTSGPGPAGPSQGPGPGPGPGSGPGPRRLPHSSSADLTVYRDQHHQYGPMRSPMSSPGYGPGPRPGPDQAGHPQQQNAQNTQPMFGPPLDRRNLDPRADTRSDPRFLNMPSPASPGAYDRQLSDVAEDIEEKSVLNMPGVAVKDFASKEDGEAETEKSEEEEETKPEEATKDITVPSVPEAEAAAGAASTDLPPAYSLESSTVDSARVLEQPLEQPLEQTLENPLEQPQEQPQEQPLEQTLEQEPAVTQTEPEPETETVTEPGPETEPETEIEPQIEPAVVVPAVEAEEAEKAVEEEEEPATPRAAVVEPAAPVEKPLPELSFLEPVKAVSPALSLSSLTVNAVNTESTEFAGTSRPLSTGFGNLPLTPVTPTNKLPSHAVSSSISFAHAVEAPAQGTPERSPERSQAIAERRRTRYPTQAEQTPPDTPIVDAMPRSPVAVVGYSQYDSKEEEEEEEEEEKQEEPEPEQEQELEEEADLSTDATTLNEDASRPQTPAAVAEVAGVVETQEAGIEAGIESETRESTVVEPTESEETKDVEVAAVAETTAPVTGLAESEVAEAKEAEVAEIEEADVAEATVEEAAAVPAIEQAGDETVAAEPAVAEAARSSIVETVVAVHPRSGSGATNYSSPPMSPISLPAGDAEPSAQANWPLPSVFVSAASRSPSPSSLSPSLAEAIAGPLPTSQSIPTIVTDDEGEGEGGDDHVMDALPSPTRKTAFTASIYAKDIGIGPYAFDDAALGAGDKAADEADVVEKEADDTTPTLQRPATPTHGLAPTEQVMASPESTYSWGGEEVMAVTPPRQSDEIVEAAETEAAETEAGKSERGVVDVAPESIGLARGPSILADMETLSPRGKRRWNIAHHADQETLQERLMEVASPAARSGEFDFGSVEPASPTRKVKKGPPPPLTSVPQFDRHVPTNVVDKFGTTFI